MKRFVIAMVIAVAFSGVVVIRFASAADCSTRAVAVDRSVAVVPFAVPVATPVAIVNPGGVLYGANPSLSAATSSAAVVTGSSIAAQASSLTEEELADFRAWRTAKANAAKANQAAAEPSLIAEHCAKCHSGAAPKAGLALAGSLAPELRLRAIRAVLQGDMPPGRPLPSTELTRLLRELSSASGASKQSPP